MYHKFEEKRKCTNRRKPKIPQDKYKENHTWANPSQLLKIKDDQILKTVGANRPAAYRATFYRIERRNRNHINPEFYIQIPQI